ncbi:thioredoxin-dependent thiol peroxidase [Paenibacillus abyssi]|uniref:thioredoxin-dependent peroxiredoxin n=1 Tax=Paenibacillus abyssi TaxID=1340531 RepID=A0A917LHK1_9BACL|nr:thioredoxin-dependent thiol peroxidase [Paenibacillus abyssi]GGG23967.1 peroxiredoxin [Paenibacillus abyssi]
MSELTIGREAPDFTLPASSGENIRLSDLKGKNVVLYFYPKDMTSSCTTQACDFRDRHSDFSEANAVILGISLDPINRHEKFIDKYNLPFLLLTDEEHRVCELYGVWQMKQMYGKQYMGIVRSTFVIDTDGVLVKEWRKVKVRGHIEEVLQYVKENL